MTDSVVVEGHVKLRDGKKVPAPGAPSARGGPRPPPPCPEGREPALPSRPRLTLSLCLSLQWKSRWLVLRKPSPVAGKTGPAVGPGLGAGPAVPARGASAGPAWSRLCPGAASGLGASPAPTETAGKVTF